MNEERPQNNGLLNRFDALLMGVHESAERELVAECLAVAEMLVQKNKSYGNSALDPVRIFSKASPVEQILVRIDDKLSRLSRGSADGEDVEKDLMGYLVLLRIARRKAAARG